MASLMVAWHSCRLVFKGSRSSRKSKPSKSTIVTGRSRLVALDTLVHWYADNRWHLLWYWVLRVGVWDLFAHIPLYSMWNNVAGHVVGGHWCTWDGFGGNLLCLIFQVFWRKDHWQPGRVSWRCALCNLDQLGLLGHAVVFAFVLMTVRHH